MTQARSVRLDNAKAILIILVVWGHLIEQAALAGGASRSVYGAIYIFHMPAFVMVSGMVSRAALDRAELGRIARRLIAPLIVFQIVYWPFLDHFAPSRLGSLLTPHWFLWFLASLAAWRVMLPIFARLKYPVASAVLLALAAGFVPDIDRTLSLSRTLVFFPAFAFGYFHAGRSLELAASARSWCWVGFAAILGLAAWAFGNGADLLPLYGSLPYARIAGGGIELPLIRLLLIVLGLAASVFFLAIVPDAECRLRRLGASTFAVFLWHGVFVVLFWRASGGLGAGGGPAFILSSLAAAILLSCGIAGLSSAVPRLPRGLAPLRDRGRSRSGHGPTA